MNRHLRTAFLFASIASTSLMGANLAMADTAKAPAGVRSQQDQPCNCQGKAGHRAGKRYFERMAQRLGLSDQQKAQIKGIFKGFRSKNEALFAGLKTERRELRHLIHSGSADDAAIRAQSAKVAAAEADLAVAKAAMVKQIQGVLTPDQLAKAKVMMQEREQKMEQFRGRHHGGFGPME